MGEIYITGVILAFGIGLLKVFATISILMSTRTSNLRKLGLRYHYFTGTFVGEGVPAGSFSFYCIYILGLAPIFSWISVISAIFTFISSKVNTVPIPERLKEIQYKIATIDLPLETLKELTREANQVLGIPDNSSNSAEENHWQLEAGDYFSKIEVDPENMTFEIYRHPADYSSTIRSAYQYKFEGEKVFARTTSRVVEHYGKESWYIKDSVVLEREIRERHENDEFKISSIDEVLDEQKSLLEWSEVKNKKYNYFLMFRQPEVFPVKEFRKILRRDLERLLTGKGRLFALADKFQAKSIETEDGYTFKVSDSSSKEENLKFIEQIQDESAIGISLGEFYSLKKEIEIIEYFLKKAVS